MYTGGLNRELLVDTADCQFKTIVCPLDIQWSVHLKQEYLYVAFFSSFKKPFGNKGTAELRHRGACNTAES